MKIHAIRLTSFGKFKDKTITFADGINYIYGENEAGKSTVMAFIKSMIYGFSGRGNDGDRKRYMPWDGGRLSGEMDVTLSDGRRIIISRTSGRIPSQDTCRVINAITGEECDVDLPAEIGIGENAFLKTVFIRQSDVSLGSGDEELTDKLVNLAGSGDSDVGYDDAMQFLKDRIRYYKHQRGDGGHINELKKKITTLQDEIEFAETDNRKYIEYIAAEKQIASEIESLQSKQRSLQAERTKIQTAAVEAMVEAAKKRMLAMEEGKRETEALLEGLKDNAKVYSVFNNPISDSIYVPLENAESFEVQRRVVGRQMILFFVSAILTALVGALLAVLHRIPLGIGCLIISCVLGLVTFTWCKKKGKVDKILLDLKQREADKMTQLSAFGCSTLKEFTEKLAKKQAIDERIAGAEEKLQLLTKEANAAAAEYDRLCAGSQSYIGVYSSGTDASDIEDKLQQIESLLAEKNREAATLQGVLKAGRDGKESADLLIAEQAYFEECLKEEEEVLSALQLAADTLEEVYAELSSDFTPKINKKATEYFSVLTGRSDEKLLLDKKYTVTMGRGEHKSLKVFSGGTIDQAFLAVRLAIAEMVLKDEGIPLFLDDSFLQYDSTRELNAVLLLQRIAEKRQVFWFSCKKKTLDNVNEVKL